MCRVECKVPGSTPIPRTICRLGITSPSSMFPTPSLRTTRVRSMTHLEFLICYYFFSTGLEFVFNLYALSLHIKDLENYVKF